MRRRSGCETAGAGMGIGIGIKRTRPVAGDHSFPHPDPNPDPDPFRFPGHRLSYTVIVIHSSFHPSCGCHACFHNARSPRYHSGR